ncbi:DNA polymerase III subunit gamma/tau [Neisseria bacilliformis]|uniref:DNA polymerase III subunit gamma/tau n=1 Tax=Neisseria bacilliformis TaxID=267212 RepID=UPI00066926F2|nr:DNA polymerase III subunit gamma/tau [Neisseria bacilliformis]
MAYQVLARKWRPKTFADLVGQEHVVKALQNALDKGRLHHAYLLTGTRGVGKTTIARILAKSLNCENPAHGEPCGRCPACTQIDAGRYVDLLEIDAASNTGIDNIREVLENAQYAPTAGKYKVYIIDEVHMLSKSAFNAMLKTLEEPPEHVKFILATTDPHKVPVTVLSRCLQFVLRNMTAQQAAAHLEHVLTAEGIPFEKTALQLLARAANGSMRDALSLLDQAIAMGGGGVAEADVRHMIGAVDKRYLYELIAALAAQNGEKLLQKAQEMAECAVGFDSALGELALLLQRLALAQTVPAAIPADDPERDTLHTLAAALGAEQIQLYYQCALHGKQDLSLAPDEYAGFVMTLLRMLAFAPLAAPAQTDARIEGSTLHDPAPPPARLPQTPAQNADTVSDGHSQTPTAQAERPSENAKPAAAPAAPPQNADGFSDGLNAAQPERPSEKAVITADTHVAHDTDTPPWAEPAAASTVGRASARHSDGLSETQSERPSENTVSAPPQPASAAQPPAAPPQDANGFSDGHNAAQAERPSEKTEVPADTHAEQNTDTPPWTEPVPEPAANRTTAPHSDGLNQMQTAQPERPSENPASVPPPPAAPIPAGLNPLPPAAFPFDQAAAQEEIFDNEEENTEEADFAPMPELSADNWHAIAKRLGKRFGAAQMLADNMAWTGYDPAAQSLRFALNGNSRTTTTKEYFDKIRRALAEAYRLDALTMQTEPWQEGQGWETPAMRRRRIQHEGRQEARRRLEADPACRELMAAVQAQSWIEDSLKRAEDFAEYSGEA